MMKPKCDQIIAEVNVGVDLTVQSNIGFGDQVAPSSSQHSSFILDILFLGKPAGNYLRQMRREILITAAAIDIGLLLQKSKENC
uniref:Uncharacterized protein n=1 Tax=Salix viminalis TaxID=40686 RepID=A0A6N2L0P7_SALVM